MNPSANLMNLQQAAGNQAVGRMLEASVSNEQHFMANRPPIVDDVLSQSGQPLSTDVRREMEPMFGAGLEDIRVHRDGEAATSAQAVSARAYTVGNDLVFGAGQFQPETPAGRELLAHELGHAMQARQPGTNPAAAGKTGGVMRAPLTASDTGVSLFKSSIPAPTVMRIGGTIVATLYFGQNFFLLDSQNLKALDQIGDELRFILDPVISVDGYASSEGTEKYNQDLSENRRSTVIALLRSKVVGTATFGGQGHGESAPSVAEDAKDASGLEAQRALNRRVTIVVSSPYAAKPSADEQRKPTDIFKPLPQRPETEEERRKREEEERRRKLKQMLDLGEIKPPKRPSFNDVFWKAVDEKVDEISRKVGVPEKYRGMVRDAAHAAIEKGAEEALDKTLDAAKLDDTQKKAIKAAIKAAAQTPGP